MAKAKARTAIVAKRHTLKIQRSRQKRVQCMRPKVLSLQAPELAAAILGKQKRVENRVWELPAYMIGKWIALHVGGGYGGDLSAPWIRKHVEKSWDREKALSLRGSQYPPMVRRLSSWDTADKRSSALPPRSAIVGLIRFRGQHKLGRGEKTQNPWALGPYLWEIDRVFALERPITNVNGNLGFWFATPQLLKPTGYAQLNKALQHVKSTKGAGCYKQ